MSKKKNPLLHATCADCCHHENDAGNPEMVREFVHCDGVSIFATRQCSICSTTAVRSQPVRKDYGKPGKDGKPDLSIDRFYDWEKGSWEPVSKHGEYQDKKAARLKAKPKEADPDEPTVIEE
jgi:hypothetical protein